MDVIPIPRSRLSVSIVLHNSALALLRRTLQSLHESAQLARETGYLEHVAVYLVDNASDAHYRTLLAAEVAVWSQNVFFTVVLRPQAHNSGFGCGHNVVLPLVDSDFHLILNPDVELETDALRAGLSSLSACDDIALLSPMAYGGTGQREFLCKRYPTVLVLLLRGFAPRCLHRLFHRQLGVYEMRDQCGGEKKVDVAIASGCFMLLRTSTLRAARGFNEAFFLYFEDFDLSLRLGRQGRLVFDPRKRIVHHGGYSARKG